MNITASKLYNFIQCEHRIWRDVYGPQEEKIKETNPFVQMLWDKGVQHEKNIVENIGKILDLKDIIDEEKKIKETIEAIKVGEPLIYQGSLRYGDLLGVPDLLQNNGDGTYMPVDIKSGMGVEGVDEGSDNEGKYKKHYAVQLALYSEVLIANGFANKHQGVIIDINSERVVYDLDQPMGLRTPMTWWEYYQDIKLKATSLLKNETQNKPAYSGKCKLCPWYSSCKKWIKDSHDLTNIFYVGRSARDTLSKDLDIENYDELITLDVDQVMIRKEKEKGFLYRVGKDGLEKSIKRAKLIKNKSEPIIYSSPIFPKKSYELFFDIEDDPTQSFIYLHGVYERSPKGERFVPFVAKEKSDISEKEAWSQFWDYIRSLPKDDFAVYYYSHHEKTTYHKMRELYPDVVTTEELEWFFSKEIAIDLYSDYILKITDWPLMSYSLKEIAQYLNFKWRDESPSGALSIQWFNKYLETKDQKDLERILLYNEDDCKATMVIKDYLENPIKIDTEIQKVNTI